MENKLRMQRLKWSQEYLTSSMNHFARPLTHRIEWTLKGNKYRSEAEKGQKKLWNKLSTGCQWANNMDCIIRFSVKYDSYTFKVVALRTLLFAVDIATEWFAKNAKETEAKQQTKSICSRKKLLSHFFRSGVTHLIRLRSKQSGLRSMIDR